MLFLIATVEIMDSTIALPSYLVSNGSINIPIRTRLAVKMMPTVIVTFAIAQWVSRVLGTARLETMVIAFAWATATGHQLLISRPMERAQGFRWSLDTVLSALGGQILWVVLPCVQFAYPDAWFCAPLTIPPTLVATGMVAAVCWPLHPFVMRLRAWHASARHSEFDAPVLYCSFFLLSGNLVFAASAYASVARLFASRLNWRELIGRSVPQNYGPMCHIESHTDLSVSLLEIASN